MKYQTKNNVFKETNCEMRVSKDLKEVCAFSYDWWKFIATDNVGNIFFNNTYYSSSTRNHQREAKAITKRLGIKPHFILNNTRTGFQNGIENALKSEIKNYQSEIKELIGKIKTKGSWKRVNIERRTKIRELLFRIKDLRRIKNEYLDKKPIPIKKITLKAYEVHKWSNLDALSKFKERYFKKPSGAYDLQGLTDLLNTCITGLYGGLHEPPTNLEPIKELLNLKAKDLKALLAYSFTQDTVNMIPPKDSIDYRQLLRWLKPREIKPGELTTLDIEALHTYLTNKINRKSYTPAEAKALPVSPVLLDLEQKTEGLMVVKTDQDLRREGRQQSHCIGSKSYLNQCFRGYQALRFKGFTFFLNPDLTINQTHGKRNTFTPLEVQNELNQLIKNQRSKAA